MTMRKMLAFIDGSIYNDSVCDHVIWAAAGDQSDVSLFNVIEELLTQMCPQISPEARELKQKINFCLNSPNWTRNAQSWLKRKVV